MSTSAGLDTVVEMHRDVGGWKLRRVVRAHCVLDWLPNVSTALERPCASFLHTIAPCCRTEMPVGAADGLHLLMACAMLLEISAKVGPRQV